jgi:hypothetical protein
MGEDSMTDATQQQPSSGALLPPDDPQRKLSVVNPDGPHVRHVSLVGDTSTILLTGKELPLRRCGPPAAASSRRSSDMACWLGAKFFW